MAEPTDDTASPLGTRMALGLVVGLVLIAVYSLLPGTGPEAPAEPEVPVVKSRTAKAGTVRRSPAPLPEQPQAEERDVLATVAETSGRTLIACPVPSWVDDPHILRPAWVKDGILYELVRDTPSQRPLYASLSLDLSYSLEEVEAARGNPALATPILEEAAELDPKAHGPELVGVLRWGEADEDGNAGCSVHETADLVALRVYVENSSGELTEAFVKAGERGARTVDGSALFDVVEGAEIRIQASGREGASAMVITPGEGTEAVLQLGDSDLPDHPEPDWMSAREAAAAQLDAEGRATLTAWGQHMSTGTPEDPLIAAVRQLAESTKPEKSSGKRAVEKPPQ